MLKVPSCHLANTRYSIAMCSTSPITARGWISAGLQTGSANNSTSRSTVFARSEHAEWSGITAAVLAWALLKKSRTGRYRLVTSSSFNDRFGSKRRKAPWRASVSRFASELGLWSE